MKCIDIFNKKFFYDFGFDLENYIKALDMVAEEIRKPLLLSEDGCSMQRLSGIPRNVCSIFDSLIQWVYENKKTGEEDIQSFLLSHSTKDAEWTRQGNKYRPTIYVCKITLNPDLQDDIVGMLNGYKNKLTVILDEMTAEREKKEQERKDRKSKWTLSRYYSRILPYGNDEYGQDGYIDADYVSSSGDVIRMVCRSIFDFGVYSYPKRLEEKNDALNRDLYTENEKSLISWLREFGEFGHRIRM